MKNKYQCTPPLLPPNARASGYASAIAEASGSAKASGSANASGSAKASGSANVKTWGFGEKFYRSLSQTLLANIAYKNINSAKNVEFQLTTNEVAKINRINLNNILNIWFNMLCCAVNWKLIDENASNRCCFYIDRFWYEKCPDTLNIWTIAKLKKNYHLYLHGLNFKNHTNLRWLDTEQKYAMNRSTEICSQFSFGLWLGRKKDCLHWTWNRTYRL